MLKHTPRTWPALRMAELMFVPPFIRVWKVQQPTTPMSMSSLMQQFTVDCTSSVYRGMRDATWRLPSVSTQGRGVSHHLGDVDGECFAVHRRWLQLDAYIVAELDDANLTHGVTDGGSQQTQRSIIVKKSGRKIGLYRRIDGGGIEPWCRGMSS